jgi:hypothetical protein
MTLFNILIAKCATTTYFKADGTRACGFFLKTKDLTWVQANKQCFAEGGRLPTVMSSQENDMILNTQV